MGISNSGDGALAKRATFWDLFDSVFTSVRLALFLLFALAVASIIGTVIPQDIAAIQSTRAHESFLGRLVLIFDLHQVYHSWWFLTLLVLLCLNLTGCLKKRVPQIVADWTGTRFKETFVMSFVTPVSPEACKKELMAAIGTAMHSVADIGDKTDGWRLDWTRHRIHLLGFPLIHVAIIIILLGALTGLLFGFKGAMQIREGSIGKQYSLIPSGKTANLPFEVALDKFEFTRYPSGEPKEYRSDVRLIQNGKEVHKGSIRVNHPLTYHGISLFQSDYKLVSVKGVNLELDDSTGVKEAMVITPGQATVLPKEGVKIRLVALDPGTSIRGPWIDVTIEKENTDTQTLRIFQKDSRPPQIGGYYVRLKGYQPLYASGLQIGYDPGSYVVWLGCITLLFGFVITLFTNYRRVRVNIIAEGQEKTRLRVSGSSRRMRREFRETIEKITKDAVKLA